MSAIAAAMSAAFAMKVVTYNLHLVPWERKRRMENAALALSRIQPDVVALQEVGQGLILPGAPDELIAGKLSFPFRVREHLENAVLWQNHLAIVSRFPITASAKLKFDENMFLDRKGAQYARLETPGGPVAFFNFHLAPAVGGEVKRAQFVALEAFIAEHRGSDPVVLAGDFNERHDAAEFSAFLARTQGVALFNRLPKEAQRNTWTSSRKRECVEPRGTSEELLDHVVVLPGAKRKIAFTGGGIESPKMAPHPSDHCPVFATLRLEQ